MQSPLIEETADPITPNPLHRTLLEIDDAIFAAKFDEAPFLIKHDLCSHPLFELDRLMQLARALPAASLEYNAGELPINCDASATPMNGLSPQETIQRIRECKSWMVMKNVEQNPAYRDLLLACLDEVKQHSESIAMGLTKPEAFIFLTSPSSVTPYHMDPEHNFLLQIRGTKYMTVFERGVVSPGELERFHKGAHRNLVFSDDLLQMSTTFDLTPGVGLHVPVTAPHFVRNGDDVSISFSITFRTPDLERIALAHRVNGQLRARGMHPRPVGENVYLNSVKAMTFRALRKSQTLLGSRT